MDIEAIGNVKRSSEPAKADVGYVDSGKNSRIQAAETKPVAGVSKEQTNGQDSDAEQNMPFDGKEPSKSTIDSAVSNANNRMVSTRCEYSYDEDTKRVSIKVFDKENDELIREVPPEESLEMLQKMWELAGLIVDEKR